MSDFVEGQTGHPEIYEERAVKPKVPRDDLAEKRRSNIGPYKLERRITGGKAECWVCTDTRDGETRFLKKFPSPKMPSEKERAFDRVFYESQVAKCNTFLLHHQSIASDLKNEMTGNGSLVQGIDAFWHDSSFFKIYPFISDLAPLDAKTTKSWNAKQRVLTIRSVLLALRELHINGIVHADIKRENIHLIESPTGALARLIDFDDSYRTLDPPPPTVLGGTEDYYSPEVLVYKGFASSRLPLELGTHSDLFSLSLVLHETFSPIGSGPRWSATSLPAPGLHVLAGHTVSFESLGTGKPLLEYRLRQCLQLLPAERPNITELLSACGTNLGRVV